MTYLEGVYWDLDGTIANTELEAHLPAFNKAFNDFGINWNWDTNIYVQLLKINGGKNRIAHYSRLNNDHFPDDFILKIHEKKQFHYLEILKKNCVLCNSKNLKRVINFGKTPLANSYPKNLNKKERLFNLSCVLCSACGHLQLKELINPKILLQLHLYLF